MNLSGSFSAVGVSLAAVLKPRERATYTIDVTAADTFNGILLVERSRTAGQTWETVATYSGVTVDLVDAVATALELVNESAGLEYYRFRCSNAGDEDGINYALTLDTEQVAQVLLSDGNGKPLIGVTGAGRLVILADVLIQGAATVEGRTVLEGTVNAAALPAADPAVSGDLYLATAAVKQSV